MQNRDNIKEKIVCSPHTLTDADITIILNDPELREIYESVVMISAATDSVPDFDVDKSLAEVHSKLEVKKLKIGVFKKLFSSVSFRRAAAIGLIFIALTAVAISSALFLSDKSKEAEDNKSAATEYNIGETADQGRVSTSGKILYDDAPLSEILQDICARYHCKVEYKDDSVCDYRFHVTLLSDASLDEAIATINAFDEVKLSFNGGVITVE